MDRKLIVETASLTKVYGDGKGVRALDSVDLCVPAGQMLAIMGPSGSGKSTLLNLLGALDLPTSGVVRVNGRNLAEITHLDRFRAREVGFVFQLHNLIPTLTALENVMIPMIERRGRQERARQLLSLVGIADRSGALPAQLSGGERQRVAIARALANGPALVLADEPTGNLDTEHTQEIIKLFRHLNEEKGITIAIVTHNPMVALACDRIVTLQDGRVRQDEMVDARYRADIEQMRDTPLGRLVLGQAEAGSQA